MTLYNDKPPFKKYFNHVLDPCYNNEKLMYDKLVTESFNQHGVKCIYYVVDWNTEYDRVYGEDLDRTIERKFMVMTYFMLPPEDRLISVFAIENTDNFKMWASKIHFAAASTTRVTSNKFGRTRGCEPEYKPQAGDIIKSTANNVYYEILNVKDAVEKNQFLQHKGVWEMDVRVYRDLHYNINPSTSASLADITPFTDQDDYLAINDVIDTEKQDIIITSADDIANGCKPPNDPFGNW